MAKRFTDTDKWSNSFFRSLSLPNKLLWLFILDHCDHAGIWSVDKELAEFRLKSEIDWGEFLELSKNEVIINDTGDKWIIPSFIETQYGILDKSNRVHRSAISHLKKIKIERSKLAPSKVLIRALEGAKDKDTDKDKDFGKGGVGEKPFAANPIDLLLASSHGDEIRKLIRDNLKPKTQSAALDQMACSLMDNSKSHNLTNTDYLVAKVRTWLADNTKFEEYKMTEGDRRAARHKRAREVWDEAYTPEQQALLDERINPYRMEEFARECVDLIAKQDWDAETFAEKVRLRLNEDLGHYRKLTEEEIEERERQIEAAKRKYKYAAPDLEKLRRRSNTHRGRENAVTGRKSGLNGKIETN